MRARAGAVLLGGALACGLAAPEPLARVVEVSPRGGGVPVDTTAFLRFSAPVSAEGLVDGRRLLLVEASDVRAAVALVESDGGAAGEGVAVEAALDEGARRVVLRPRAPLHGLAGYALVLSSRARAADGRPVLDPDGRQRPFVAPFETGAPPGPPPAPALSEVRADAETPEAGGEYVEVANLGEGALDLHGWRLAKRTAAGALSSCAILAPGPDPLVPPGGVALLVGGAYDGRYRLPPAVPALACGGSALLGGIANDRAPEISLLDPTGAVAATIGAAGAPMCAAAIEKIDPAGADVPENLACTEGTPGVLSWDRN